MDGVTYADPVPYNLVDDIVLQKYEERVHEILQAVSIIKNATG